MLTSSQDHWRIKRQEFESWSEKTRKKILDQSEAEKKKLFETKFSQDVGFRCRRETRWEVGGWAVGRDKSVRTVRSVGGVGGEEDINKCGVGCEGGRGGLQTCERDGRRR